jgi:protein O-mannosyl-transferase
MPPSTSPRRSRNKAPVAPATPRTRWRHAAAILGLSLLALLVYSNSFSAGLVYDSSWTIAKDPRVQAATSQNVSFILTQDYWSDTPSSGLYRPLSKLSYLFNYAILGNGEDPAGYHWINFAVHAANIALVYVLGLLLLGDITRAFAFAALWGLHPVLTESVTNVVGRADLLAGFGVLGGLVCHIRAVDARRKGAWLAALALAAGVAVFSKENGVVVLAAMLIYDFIYRRGSWRRCVPGYLALAVPLALFVYARQRIFSGFTTAGFSFLENPLAGADFWTAKMTAIKVIGKYLGLMLWPARLSADYAYNQVPLFTWRWSSPEDWKAIAALGVCLAAAGVAVVGYRRNKPVCFFIALLFAALAPTSNLVIPIGTIMAERFLYLPAIGFAGCLVLAIFAVCRRLPGRWRQAAPAAAGLLALAFGVRAYARNFDWSSEPRLWASAVQVSPGSYVTHLNRAVSLMNDPAADPAAVDGEFERCLSILAPVPDDRSMPAAYANAGAWYRSRGDRTGGHGDSWYRQALAVLLHGERIDRLAGRRARLRDRSSSRAEASYSAWPGLYLELGRIYMRLSQPANAIEAYRYGRVARLQPELTEELAAAYRATGDTRNAAISLAEGAILGSNRDRFLSELVALYRETDPRGCAVRIGPRFADLNRDCPIVREDLCTASRNVAGLYRETGLATRLPGLVAALDPACR